MGVANKKKPGIEKVLAGTQLLLHSDLWYCFIVSLGLDVEFGKGDFWAKKNNDKITAHDRKNFN